jgi:hypothetical protein
MGGTGEEEVGREIDDWALCMGGREAFLWTFGKLTLGLRLM